MHRPIYIITGLMGSGKSTVTNLFKLRHFEVLNMDEISKEIMLTDSDMKVAMISAFGKNVINEDTTYNIDYIKGVYFDPLFDTEREQFEHDLDIKIRDIFNGSNRYFDVNKEGVPLIIEIPSFNLKRFERIYHCFFTEIKYVINVSANYKDRMDRVHKRGLSDEEISNRNRLQTDYSYPQNKPDVVGDKFCNIDNDGTVEELYDKITALMEQPDFFDERTKDLIFDDYMSKMPSFVRANMKCYVYYNSTGCGSCPCPCKCSDKHFEETVKAHLKKVQDD